MTPFRNDEENPFARESVWPKMPQTPLRLAGVRTVLGRGVAHFEPKLDIDYALVVAAPALAQAAPRRRPDLRLTPLIAAAAVGAGGLLTLFLLIGNGPESAPVAAPQVSPSALAVGELVGQQAAVTPQAKP
jgi:hypothetical protein